MSSKPTSVRCMLLPLTSLNLLIPNSAVAEIIGYSTPRQLSDTSALVSRCCAVARGLCARGRNGEIV